MKPSGRDRRKNILRVFTFVFERFGEHELANHAAAGAYAFLLSATPALLLVLGLSSTLLAPFPQARAAWLEITGEIFGGLWTSEASGGFFSRPLGLGAAIFALLSLIWAARLFILTVQRGIRVIWGISPLAKPMRDNIITFALEFAALVLVVLILGAAEGFRFFLDYLAPGMGETVSVASRVVAQAVPALFIFLYCYLTFRFIPLRGPKSRTSALAAALCLVVFLGISSILSYAIDQTHYDLLYGVFGSLIVLLLKVYMFFTVYFYAAEFAFIHERFDALLFARFLRISRAEKPGRWASSLFAHPTRLVKRYGRIYRAGQTIFREGDRGKEVYYLLAGLVGVFLMDRDAEGRAGNDRQVATIHTGELFGEIADLIEEGRTATLKAETDLEVMVLPPELFESLLASDAQTSRRMIDLLSRRLKEANVRVAAEGAMNPLDEIGPDSRATTGKGDQEGRE